MLVYLFILVLSFIKVIYTLLFIACSVKKKINLN